MSDLISRQAAIDAFDCSVGGVPVESVKYVSEYADKMMSRINALPSAQPEIIRCGECRHLHDNDCPAVGWGRDDDDYCAWAERNNDE